MLKVKEAAPTLEINPHSVCFFIVKAREFGAKVAPDDPDSGSNPVDDKFIDVLEDLPGDPTLVELRGTIAALNEDESRELVALVFVGRGDFTKDQWRDALAEADNVPWRNRARYLSGTPLLGDYLEEALTDFGISCTDFELEKLSP